MERASLYCYCGFCRVWGRIMASDQPWQFAPVIEIAGCLLVLYFAPVMFGFIVSATSHYSMGIAEQLLSNLMPLQLAAFFAIPGLVASLMTISSRSQWTKRSVSSRVFLNVVVHLCYLVVFPILVVNTDFAGYGWFWGIYCILFLDSLFRLPVVGFLVGGVLLNVVLTVVLHFVNPRLPFFRSSEDCVIPGCLGMVFYGLIMFGPFVVLSLLSSVMGISALDFPYALYLGMLLPGLWPNFLLNLGFPIRIAGHKEYEFNWRR